MYSTSLLLCCLLTWVHVQAITIPVERADIKNSLGRSSMVANGWRPVTKNKYEELGSNHGSSSSGGHEKSAAPLHPVLGKLQEHMAADKLKPSRKAKPQDYSPPTILGSFSVFGHAATKARGDAAEHQHSNKHAAATESKKDFAYLIPPPKDVVRFEVEPQRKIILRDSTAYLRQPSYLAQDIRNPQYYQKPLIHYAATQIVSSPLARPFIPGYGGVQALQQQQQQQQQRHQDTKHFESLKLSNAKGNSHAQLAAAESVGQYNNKESNNEQHALDSSRYQQSHPQVLAAGVGGNYYGQQVNHQVSPYVKSAYERDPAFLVHESHEVSYLQTPSSVYNRHNNYRPLHYDTYTHPSVYTSTIAPSNRGGHHHHHSSNDDRNGLKHHHDGSNNKNSKNPHSEALSGQIRSAYYVSEHQDLTPPPSAWPPTKTKYSSDINEVLPKPNQPVKFNQEAIPNSPINSPNVAPGRQQVVHSPLQYHNNYLGAHTRTPEVQQQYHYNVFATSARPPQTVIPSVKAHDVAQQQYNHNSFVASTRYPQDYHNTNVPQVTNHNILPPVEYETPESISLKHFNEQQRVLQQQLLQRDRQRLAEQERQQQQEIERQQAEELKKRKEEIKALTEQQKLAEDAKKAEDSDNFRKEQQPHRHRYTTTESSHVTEKAFTQEQYITSQLQPESVTTVSEVSVDPFIDQQKVNPLNNNEQVYPQNNYQDYSTTQGLAFEELLKQQVAQQHDSYKSREPVHSQDQRRRKKPNNEQHEDNTSGGNFQTPHQEIDAVDPNYQTTLIPETTTPRLTSTLRSRTRRPGVAIRRRRPSTTTTTPEPSVSSVGSDENVEQGDYLKYEREESYKRRRVKPTQVIREEYEVVTERRPNIRKRPGHRNKVNPGEPFDAEIVTEIVPVTEVSRLRESNSYTTVNEGPSGAEVDTSYPVQTSTKEQQYQHQVESYPSTESTPVEYYTESTNSRSPQTYSENYPENFPTKSDNNVRTNIPLEELFTRTEGGNLIETITTALPSTRVHSTTTEASTTTSTRATLRPSNHKIRPLRYGNATRPRFSIKDYKSRMDYKNRLAQGGSSESSSSTPQTPPVSSQTRQRNNLGASRTSQSADSNKDGGKYKYMSRVNYRTTSTTTPSPTVDAVEGDGSTTERINKFTPKRRLNHNHLYRSRVNSTSSSTPAKKVEVSDSYSKQSTARPENVFSSVRRRPAMKSRLELQKDRKEVSTEMSAEETSFYSTITSPDTIESVNEVYHTKDEDNLTINKVESKPADSTSTTTYQLASNDRHVTRHQEESENTKIQDEATAFRETLNSASDDELFAKASQSVADLTSSASALYEKPGLFKAVSPVTDSRAVSPHFKISTDEPTLPIEAFFQQIGKN